MEVFSILVIVLSGVTISSAIHRLWLGFEYDFISVTSLVVAFGSVVLAIMLYRSLGIMGVLLTVLTPILLHLVYVRFLDHTNTDRGHDQHDQRVWGGGYSIVLLLFFSVTGIKSGIISTSVNEAYGINSVDLSFVVVLCLILISGSIAILMTLREVRSIR